MDIAQDLFCEKPEACCARTSATVPGVRDPAAEVGSEHDKLELCTLCNVYAGFIFCSGCECYTAAAAKAGPAAWPNMAWLCRAAC